MEHAIEDFVTHYNNEQYHESLDNMTPADVYFGRAEEVKTRREQIKKAHWKSDVDHIDKAFKTDYIGSANPLLFDT